MIETIRALDISCALSERDSIYYVTRAEAEGPLRREMRERRANGLPGRWLNSGALRRATGIDGVGAIRTRGNAQLDPYRACLGLAHAAKREGARLFERSPVRRIDMDGHGVIVKSDRGAIQADPVIIATGYATPFFKPLAASFRLMDAYVADTRPISPRERRMLGLSGVMLWARRILTITRGGPRITGCSWAAGIGGTRPRRASAEAQRARESPLRRHFERLLPGLSEIDVDYAWQGLFANTPDGLPFIGPHSKYPRHLFALGYGGNGMTFGFLAARLLLDLCRGKPSRDHELFAFSRLD